MQKDTFDIDRKTASKMLNVSVRSIDRYIRAGKLYAREERGRILIDKRDILGFNSGARVPVKVTVSTRKTRLDSPSTEREKVPSTPSATAVTDGSFYKDLYEEARRALGEYHQKLEQANYRIGQLEANSMHNAPALPKLLPQHHDNAASDHLRRELQEREKEIFVLKELVQKEKTNRIVFAVITYALLILQPIFWYLLR